MYVWKERHINNNVKHNIKIKVNSNSPPKLDTSKRFYVKDFTIRSNANGLGLRSNAIKDLCPLILHQLVVGWIGKAHGPISGIRTKVIDSSRWSRIVKEGL